MLDNPRLRLQTPDMMVIFSHLGWLRNESFPPTHPDNQKNCAPKQIVCDTCRYAACLPVQKGQNVKTRHQYVPPLTSDSECKPTTACSVIHMCTTHKKIISSQLKTPQNNSIKLIWRLSPREEKTSKKKASKGQRGKSWVLEALREVSFSCVRVWSEKSEDKTTSCKNYPFPWKKIRSGLA